MRRRIASLWFPRLATDRLWLAKGSPGSTAAGWPAGGAGGAQSGGPAEGERREAPLAVFGETGSRRFILAVNLAAELAGLTPGLPLATARALCRDLATVAADPAADRALLRRLAGLAEHFTPLVGFDGDDGLALDVGGSAHLFGGEARLLATLLDRYAGAGLAVEGALADTAAAARAVARFGGGERIIPPGETAARLASLPIEALGLDRATTADLVRLGLKRLGDLYPLPRASLAARFGPAPLDHLDRVLGRRPAPLATLAFPAPWRERVGFAEAVADRAVIAAALDRALDRLCRRLAEAGRGVRRLRCTLYRPAAAPRILEVGTARPNRTPADLARLVAGRLEPSAAADDAAGEPVDGGMIEALVVEATLTEPLAPASLGGLPSIAAGNGAGAAEEAMAGLIDRLGNRLGFARILAFEPRPGHIPERAFTAVAAAAGEGIDRRQPRPAAAGDGRGLPGSRPPRPLRLLAPPEPLIPLAEWPAGGRQDPPPAFRHGRTEHRLAKAIGPERIAWAWWRDDPDWRETVRDYWRIEDTAGRRLWVFRRCGDEAAASAPAWFLHGIFP